jgi:hypothetical protein
VIRDKKGRVLGIGITNKDGQVIITYTGNSVYFKASFAGDDLFEGIDAKLELDRNENPKTSNNSVATTAAMKNTGMPIIAMILILLASFSVFTRKPN